MKDKQMKKCSGKILMLSESYFPGDIRPRREAYTLTNAGYKVSIIALRNGGEKMREDIDDIQVYRMPEITLFKKVNKSNLSFLQKVSTKIKTVVGYIFEYLYFTSACLFISFYILLKEGFDVIHAHNPPDTLFIIGAFYKLFGKQFIFDHHDLSPELYSARFSGRKDFIHKILILCEKLSCKLAGVIISTNESYKQIEIERHSINPDKIYIVRNNPIVSEFLLQKQNNDKSINKDKKILLFIGSINPQDGVDILMQSLHYLVNDLNEQNFICYIVGGGDSLQAVKQIAQDLNLMNHVDFKGCIFDRGKIKEYLYLSDIGVEPAADNEANRHSTFIKVMEYMVAGKPVVGFDLKETRYSADGGAMLVPPGDIKGFANAIKQLLNDSQLRERLGKSGLERIKTELNWEAASANLIEAYKSLALS